MSNIAYSVHVGSFVKTMVCCMGFGEPGKQAAQPPHVWVKAASLTADMLNLAVSLLDV